MTTKPNRDARLGVYLTTDDLSYGITAIQQALNREHDVGWRTTTTGAIDRHGVSWSLADRSLDAHWGLCCDSYPVKPQLITLYRNDPHLPPLFP